MSDVPNEFWKNKLWDFEYWDGICKRSKEKMKLYIPS
jgi:hypothetical protein